MTSVVRGGGPLVGPWLGVHDLRLSRKEGKLHSKGPIFQNAKTIGTVPESTFLLIFYIKLPEFFDLTPPSKKNPKKRKNKIVTKELVRSHDLKFSRHPAIPKKTYGRIDGKESSHRTCKKLSGGIWHVPLPETNKHNTWPHLGENQVLERC